LLPLLTTRCSSSGAHWSAAELAAKLGVTTRTVRRDIERLRDLGYLIHATPGVHGGYTLRPGPTTPPLLLDDAAAVAVAIALRNVAADPALREPAARAAAAIDQVLPARLRRQVEAVTSTTVPLPVPPFLPNEVVFLASACQSSERLRFGYADSSGNQSRRHVEPYRLVSTGRRWYLVARDIDKDQWRSFRADRIMDPHGTGVHARPVDPPDPVRFVSEGISAPYRWRVQVRFDAPAEVIAEQVPATGAVIEADGPGRCILTTGGDTLDFIALHLVRLDTPFTILTPPELAATCTALATRLTKAAAAAPH
jgi:predicted DNA-binding transcriptional regulator YafY